MPGNVANQIAITNSSNKINSGRLLTAVSGSNTTYTVDDPSVANYILYLPLPGVLKSSAGDTTNPNNLNVEIRTADWFSSLTLIIQLLVINQVLELSAIIL